MIGREGRRGSPPIQQLKNSMIKQFNIWVSLTTLCFVCLVDVAAGPLQKKHVAGDSKWLLHFDLDNFRGTQVGRLAVAGMLDEALAEVKKGTKLDLAPVIERIRSVTIYGSDLEREADFKGALLVQADAEAIQIFEGLLAAQSLGDSKVTVKKLPDGPNPLYSVGEELFVEVEPGHRLVLAKSRKQIDRARAVLTGKVESLAKSGGFAELLPDVSPFFFLAVVEGLGKANAGPPQAKVLQMADGGRLMLGEIGDKLIVELVLKARSTDVVGQIQAVLQGMIALATLSQSENPELQQLVRAVNVKSAGNRVTISLSYPLEEALKKLEQEIGNRTPSKSPAVTGDKKTGRD